jgi:hypothetical protein
MSLTKETTTKSIFHQLYKGKIFAKCPKCYRYLSIFEIYNEHCICGKIKFDKIILTTFEDDDVEDL